MAKITITKPTKPPVLRKSTDENKLLSQMRYPLPSQRAKQQAQLAAKKRSEKKIYREKIKKNIVMAFLALLVATVFFIFMFSGNIFKAKPWQMFAAAEPTREIELCKQMGCDNTKGFDKHVRFIVSVYALAKEGKQDQLDKLVKSNDLTVKDAVREVISSASFAQIQDPRKNEIAEMISARIKAITGQDMTEKILFPEWEHRLPKDILVK
ncbi:MAG: hypothetical protein JEZ07_01255 [Phycisphaerae bacterium]|nr:hypothetical protein [Phycisphaerae bacterium]